MIKLDASEQKVAALLLNVTNELAIEYPNLPKVTLRYVTPTDSYKDTTLIPIESLVDGCGISC